MTVNHLEPTRVGSLSDYELVQRLFVSKRSVVWRAQHRERGQWVIVKVPASANPSNEDVARYRREFDVLSRLGGAHIIRSEALLEDGAVVSIATEDVGGESVANWLLLGRLSTQEALEIGLQTAMALVTIHSHRVIHKDINPSNLVWNRRESLLKVIDFGIATQLTREDPGFRSLSGLEGTLRYIAPEQTGRINRSVDHRADLYSFGVTLYELLAGAPPFSGPGVLEYVHAHLAQSPAPLPLSAEGKAFPSALQDLIMRLLAKTPEARYQSAQGVVTDLRAVTELIRGERTSVTIGAHDVPARLTLPERLSGRESEAQALLNAHDRARNEGVQVVMVSGPSGIGKSRLIHEVHRSIALNNDLFAEGKHDPLRRDIPYAALVQALGGMLRRILAEPETELIRWRSIIHQGLGDEAAVVAEVLPELKTLLGELPQVLELAPAESQNRFERVFGSLVRCFASHNQALVLFLDDVQWADSGSLALLESLVVTKDLPMMLIMAYRDNEVGPSHRLQKTKDILSHSQVPVVEIAVGPLSTPVITSMLAEATCCSVDDVGPLAELLSLKTAGNPFFLGQILRSLDDKGVFTIDPTRGCWRWDLAEVSRAEIADNVVGLMTNTLKKLNQDSLRVASDAACLGSQFDLHDLAAVCDMSPTDCLDALWPLLDAGLLLPLHDGYKLVAFQNEVRAEFRFVHDRVHESAYALMTSQRKIEAHARIGRILLARSGDSEQNERFFDLVEHLWEGATLLTQQERLLLADLCHRAAIRARSACVFELTLTCARRSIQLYGSDLWQSRYSTALALYDEAADAAWMCDRQQEMLELAAIVKANVTDPADRLRTVSAQIRVYQGSDRFSEAINLGKDVLRDLGEHIPSKVTKVDVMKEFGIVHYSMRTIPIEQILKLPRTKNRKIHATLELASSLLATAYVSEPDLFAFLVMRINRRMIEHGHTDRTLLAVSTYSLLVRELTGNFERAWDIAKLSLSLVDEVKAEAQRCRAMFVFHYLHSHNHELLRVSITGLREAARLATLTGDREYGAYAFSLHNSYTLLASGQLDALEEATKKDCADAERLGEIPTLLRLRDILTTIDALKFKGAEGLVWGDATDKNRDSYSRYCLAYAKLLVAVIFERWDDAVEHSAACDKDADGAMGSMTLRHGWFLSALVLFARWSGMTIWERSKARAQIALTLKRLRGYAKLVPENHLFHVRILEGEQSRISGDLTAALDSYAEAISLARGVGAWREAALASELRAKALRSRNSTRSMAKGSLSEARFYYERWGARAKVSLIDGSTPSNDTIHAADVGTTVTGTTTHGTTTESISHSWTTDRTVSLDVLSVVKASQALSSEIVQEQLMAQLVHLSLENAGAQRGALLLRGDKGLEVVAEVDARGGRVVEPSLIDSRQDLCVSALVYCARTGEIVLLPDAREGQFEQDPHVRRGNIHSLLCLPIRHKGGLAGILYLEHAELVGVFTPERLQVLSLLCSQAAISLENARLYRSLEDKVAERTRELTASLGKVTEAQQALSSELAEAAKYVTSLLPAPEKDGVSTQWVFNPSLHLGGDALGYRWIDSTHFSFFVLDVCGHGVTSAMLSVAVLDTLRSGRLSSVCNELDPAAVLQVLNNTFQRDRHQGMYFTIWYGVLEVSTGRLVYASAGHPGAIVIHPKGSDVSYHELGGAGLMVGVLPDMTYDSNEFTLKPNDRVFVFSDGCYELIRPDGEVLLHEEFVSALNEVARDDDAPSQMLQFAKQIQGERPLEDDLTMLEIRYAMPVSQRTSLRPGGMGLSLSTSTSTSTSTLTLTSTSISISK